MGNLHQQVTAWRTSGRILALRDSSSVEVMRAYSRRASARFKGRDASGFSLIELSVVLIVVSLLIGGLLWPINSQLDQQRHAENRNRLQAAREVILAYAVSHVRLPCPDDPATAGAGQTGQEEFDLGLPGPSDDGNKTNGRCKVWDGFLPGSQLGLSNLDGGGHYMDGWGSTQNRVRYAVSKKFAGTDPAFTRTNGMKALSLAAMGDATDHVSICQSSTGITGTGCGTAIALSDGKSIFVVYSLGKNAPEVVSGSVIPAADEQANLNGDLVLVHHQPVETTGNVFDDHLEWVGVYSFISHMMKAGLLP